VASPPGAVTWPETDPCPKKNRSLSIILLICVADPTALGLGSSGGTAFTAMLSRSVWAMFVSPQQTPLADAWTNRVALTTVMGSAAAGATAVSRTMAGKNREKIGIKPSGGA